MQPAYERFLIVIAGVSFFCTALQAVDAEAEMPADGMTRKVAETFDQALWVDSPWNSGVGKTAFRPMWHRIPGRKRTWNSKPRYSGNGFEAVTIVPPSTLVIPGELKSLTIHVKRTDKRYGLKMSFLDGWGREKNGTSVWRIPTSGKSAPSKCRRTGCSQLRSQGSLHTIGKPRHCLTR